MVLLVTRNHLPNPSPDEINNNGNAGGGGGGNGIAGGGGNGSGEGSGNNGNSPNNNDGRKHHKIVIDLKESTKSTGFILKENYLDIDDPYDLIVFEKDGKIISTVHYDGYLMQPQIKNYNYIDISDSKQPSYNANVLIIRNATWKLYKDLVKACNVEWAAYYFKDIPEDCAKKNGFPIGKKIELHPDDNRECIIVSINNPTACPAYIFEEMNCRVHSHPRGSYESEPDQFAASKAFYESEYKLFAIVHGNSTDDNLRFDYYYPFTKTIANEWADKHGQPNIP